MRVNRFVTAIALTVGISACDNNAPELTATTAVEDSALAMEVLSAKGDSNIFGPVEDRVYEEVKAEAAKKKSAPAPKPVAKPAPVVAPPPRPVLADVSVPLSEMNAQRETKSENKMKAVSDTKRAVESPPDKRGVISSGTQLSLVTNRQVCSAHEGDTFHAVLVNSLRGSNGVMVPAGAQATAEITSAGKWGAGLSVRVNAVRVNGKSYPVSSRVAYVLPEGSHGEVCIPDGTRIDVRVTEPVEVALN